MSGRLIQGDHVAGLTCTGKRPKNEDALLIAPLADGCLLAIADGIGGHHAGEVASGIAVDVLEHHVRAGLLERGTKDPEQLLQNGFSLAHQAIIEAATGDRQGMGTTLVAALVLGPDLYIAHSGDSRAYVIDKRIVFRTRDHSVIQSLIDKDLIQEEERSHHPLRCYLTRCLGGTFGMDTVHLTLHPSDILLLSSDGFHEYISEPDIIAISRNTDLGFSIRSLVSGALQRSDDNVSVIIFRLFSGKIGAETRGITETDYSCPDE